MTVLELGFISLTAFTVAFLVLIGWKAAESEGGQVLRKKFIILVGLLVWQAYILVVSSFKAIQSYDFPPRFALAFIIPAFLFTGCFLYVNRNRLWISRIPEQWIIYFQTFRVLVETMFVFALAEGVFHKEVTIEGYNFDMIFAFSAPLMAHLVYSKRLLSRRVLVYWNFIGLGVLASVIVLFLTSIYAPALYGSEIPLLPLKSMTYPYVLIAGVLMPTAVFLHVLSLIQLSKPNNLTDKA